MKYLLVAGLAFLCVSATIQTEVQDEVQSIVAETAPDEQDGPLLGGYQKMDLQSAKSLAKFLDTNLKSVRGLRLVDYELQVVNGYNHRLTFQDKQGNKRVIIIYESIDGGYEIKADTTLHEQM